MSMWFPGYTKEPVYIMATDIVIKWLKPLTVSVDIYISKFRRAIKLVMCMVLAIVIAGQCSINIKEHNCIRFM